MSPRTILLILSLSLSTASLGAGYFLAGYWQAMPALLLIWLAWFLTRRRSVFLSSAIFLTATIMLAALGLFWHIPTVWMLAGSLAGLVGWDLLNFKAQPGSLFEKSHLRSLGLALLVGISGMLAAAVFQFQLSFGAAVGLAVLAAGGFVFGIRQIFKS
ncbi:MAG TPA: hypothetical protein VJ965_04280 [Anaerolineales bacterium]|nr:hypothetical protein [Anaerolineales bacterium]